MQIRALGWEDSLEEGMATHSSILAQENQPIPVPLLGKSHGWRNLLGVTKSDD